jgi:hypothetical protein
VRKTKSRFTHHYFYIRDEVAGPMVLRVASFLPFQVTAYLNGHNFIERQLLRQKIPFTKDDNRFVSVGDVQALQQAADQLDGKTMQARIDYWALIVGRSFRPGNGPPAPACTASMRAHRLNTAATSSSSATGPSGPSSNAPANRAFIF